MNEATEYNGTGSPAIGPQRPARSPRVEETRRRILRAALDLYASAGFRGTTTAAIAERAGVAEGSIYRHFPGKAGLYQAVVQVADQWGREHLRAGKGALDRLTDWARAVVDLADHDASLARMIVARRELPAVDPPCREGAGRLRTELLAVVASGKQEGAVRSGSADLWLALWVRVITFAVEQVATRAWTADHPQTDVVLEAAAELIREPTRR